MSGRLITWALRAHIIMHVNAYITLMRMCMGDVCGHRGACVVGYVGRDDLLGKGGMSDLGRSLTWGVRLAAVARSAVTRNGGTK